MKLPLRAGGSPRELTLELPATHSAVRQARSVARAFARLDGVSSTSTDCIALVLTELLGNAVDHGGGGGAMETEDLSGDVRMSFKLQLSQEAWLLEVTDPGGEGSGLSPDSAPAPAAPLDPEKLLELSDDEVARAIEAKLNVAQSPGVPDIDDERGRGFFLVREMVDELEVLSREGGHGHTVRVRRRYDSD